MTTRAETDWEPLADSLPVEVLAPSDAISFLLSRTRQEGPEAMAAATTLAGSLASAFHERGWVADDGGVGPQRRRSREPVSEHSQVVGWSAGLVAGSPPAWDTKTRRGARLSPGMNRARVVDGQQRSGRARSRANAAPSSMAHGQVRCSRRIMRRAWPTTRAATWSSR